MKTTFDREIKGEYIYLTYNPKIEGLSSSLDYNATQLFTKEEDINKFVDTVLKLELLIDRELVKNKYSYNRRLIILTYMNAIESISSGLDVRSKLSLSEIAERFVSGYNDKYKEALAFCSETLEHVQKVNDDETYTKDWKRYDKHNDLVKEYKLNHKLIKDEDFKINLAYLAKVTSEALDFFNKMIDESKGLK